MYIFNDDKRLTTLAQELLIKINRKTQEQQIEFIKQLVFTLPIKQALIFDPQLTQREVACLYYAARGQTSSETAKKLEVKPSTIDAHRKEILRKLKCRNIAQAVFEGISYGYISPNENDMGEK